jgi:hypothetical protein
MRLRTIALVLVAASVSAGCRADDSQGFRFASDTVANRTHEDVVNTGHAITTLPAVAKSSFTDGWKSMVHTTELYYDATDTTK